MKHFAALICVPFLAGCLQQEQNGLDLSFATYAQTPVVLTGFAVDGATMVEGPRAIQGLADLRRPNVEAGAMLLDLPQGTGDRLSLSVEWVELLSHDAYRAKLAVPVEALRKSQSGYVQMMPVFGPGGLLLVTSDQPATGSDTGEKRDVARVCGSRDPKRDFDYTATPSALPMLREILDFDRPAGTGSGC